MPISSKSLLIRHHVESTLSIQFRHHFGIICHHLATKFPFSYHLTIQPLDYPAISIASHLLANNLSINFTNNLITNHLLLTS